jgi:hypothetical protein
MMTMLTDTRGLFNRASDSSTRLDTAGARPAAAHLAMIKRFFTCALIMLAAGGAVAAIMALKIIAYLPRLDFH